MGYAFTALLASKGNIGAVEETLFVRGLTSPAAHLAWTGLTAGRCSRSPPRRPGAG